SSLAARVAGRIQKLSTVVVFERYEAEDLFDQIARRLPSAAEDKLFDRIEGWRDQIAQNPARLETVLRALLEWSVTVTDEADQPQQLRADILLIIDDLERALEPPKASETAKLGPRTEETRTALEAVLRAFDRANTTSRLLFTSRYDMALIDRSGRDLAAEAKLPRVPLRPMPERSRQKQLRAFARAQALEANLTQDVAPLLTRADMAAGGNPWIQRMLQEPILRGEADATLPALEALEAYRAKGTRPEDGSATSEFLAAEIIERLGQALTADQLTALRAATLFTESVPIPLSALEAVAEAAGTAAAPAALARLTALGLLEPWGEIAGLPHAALNPLAHGIPDPLPETLRKSLAKAALPKLTEAWQDTDGDFPFDPRGVEAAHCAIIAPAEPPLLEATLRAATAYLWRRQEDARATLPLFQAGLAALPEDHPLDADLLRAGVDVADRLGQGALLDTFLARPIRQTGANDPEAAAARARLADGPGQKRVEERALAQTVGDVDPGAQQV
ncbi:MAG: hypothetical protein AAFV96_18640, partial [Pseudomonadota bacterium]